VVKWQIVITPQAQKDAKKHSHSHLKQKIRRMLDIIREDPFQYPPPYEKLSGDLEGLYSRRINRQHRLVYQVFPTQRVVKIVRMWTHYE
jgi:toxin YoeB